MNSEKLTLKAQEAIAGSQRSAQGRSHTVLTPLHLLQALLAEEQGIAVTGLQMINAYACLANDGVLMKPYVVSKVVSPNGDIIIQNKPEVIGRPVRKDIARLVRGMMIDITRKGGTGWRAAARLLRVLSA